MIATRSSGWAMGFAALAALGATAGGRPRNCAPAAEARPGVRVLVRTRTPLTAALRSDVAATHGLRGIAFSWPEIATFAAQVDEARLADLRADPRVARADVDEPFRAEPCFLAAPPECYTPPADAPTAINDPRTWWWIDMVDAEPDDRGAYDGTGATVVVMDGAFPRNWDAFLPPSCVDEANAAQISREGRANARADQPNASYFGRSEIEHGLGVASMVVGFRFTSDHPEFLDEHVPGVAPGAKILPLGVVVYDKNAHFNETSASWIVDGFLYVARLKEAGRFPGGVVVNFSMVLDSAYPAIAAAIDYAIDHGVIVVACAGNDGPGAGTIGFPASHPRVISVGAAGWRWEGVSTDWHQLDVPESDASQSFIAGFSSRDAVGGDVIDVVAPGQYVIAPFPQTIGNSVNIGWGFVPRFVLDGGSGTFGTSFSAPMVSGIVALMLQKNPSLTQAEVRGILRTSALPIPAAAGGVETPYSHCFDGVAGVEFLDTFFEDGRVPAWGANATGAGLARAKAALAATPNP